MTSDSTTPDFPNVVGGELRDPSSGERMSGIWFVPAQPAPRPAVLLLHGFPGNEDNGDLAHALQDAGFLVLLPRYRGMWGSEGLMTLSSVLVDATTALRSLAADPSLARPDSPLPAVDPQRILVIGHSMGGFAALNTAARHPEVLGAAGLAAFDFTLVVEDSPARAMAAQTLVEPILPVHSAPLDELTADLAEHAAQWRFPALADRLAGRRILLAYATYDDTAVPAQHFAPLDAAIRAQDGSGLQTIEYAANHNFGGARSRLVADVVSWARDVTAASA